jgi:TRAP-type C4-dicarboxylate transport system permease small subunit
MFNRIIFLLQKTQIAAGGICLSIFLVSVIAQILCRYIGVSVLWTEDVSMYSFIWAVFMGASAMVYERRHFAFTSLSDSLSSPREKLVVALIISALIMTFSFFMLYYGILITRQFWNYKWITIPKFKRGPVWLCMPVAGATMALYSLSLIINDISIFRKKRG